MYKLSSRSLGKLEGVNPVLVDTVKRAIELTKVDFGVIFGVRSLETQKKLYESGRSQTMAVTQVGKWLCMMTSQTQ
jgi:peptidoglycan L-alanyl-D-glutamate endopeptidase CwlK